MFITVHKVTGTPKLHPDLDDATRYAIRENGKGDQPFRLYQVVNGESIYQGRLFRALPNGDFDPKNCWRMW